MTENPQDPQSKRTETEWTFSFETFGESIAQLMHQLGIGEDADLQTIHLAEPLVGVAQAKVRLDLTVGRVTIEPLPADSPNLIEADVTAIGAVEMVASTEGDVKTVRLRQKRSHDDDLLKPMKDAVDTVARNNELQWTVRLSPNVPIHLDVNAGLTLDTFHLNGLNIPRLSLDGGAGKTVVTLPAGVCNAEIEGGVGILELTVPDNARSTLDVHIGAGNTDITLGTANVQAEIEGGVGNCTVRVPAGLALRIQAESGLGNITVPEDAAQEHFESEFISESGTWQTAGYAFATEKADLRYEGGVGSLVVQRVSEA
jgi:hypothetical protein